MAGRRAIAQYLVFDDALREAIVAQVPLRQLKDLALDRGCTSWMATVHPMLLRGEISIDEARRALAN